MKQPSAQHLGHSKVSIIIATYNREAKLNRLLKSIDSNLPELKPEIIIVDDSEKECRIDEENLTALTGRLQIIHNTRRVFFTRARNLGWKKARGEYIFFIDDDNILAEKTIERLSSTFDNNPRIGALMPVVYYEGRHDLVWVYSTPFAQGRWSFSLEGRNTVERRRPIAELLDTDALPNAFMVRKSVIDQIGGFDESFLMSSSSDLCQRIKELGFGTYALTTAQTYHDVTLPTERGYWAEHASTDPERRYHDVRDWFILMSRLHQGEPMLLPKEFVRSLPFILASMVGVLLHPAEGRKRILPTYISMIRGMIDGMKGSSTLDQRELIAP